jgi:hypothetical protein
MNFSFKKFYEEYPHETGAINRLPGLDMHSQAVEDQEIHRRAIAKGSFDAEGNEFLKRDMETKERFKELLKKSKAGEEVSVEEKNELIALLQKDLEGHHGYLSRGDLNPKTGSAEWHKLWIGIYEKWLAWLQNHKM